MNHTPSLFVANPKEAARRLRVYPALVAECRAAIELLEIGGNPLQHLRDALAAAGEDTAPEKTEKEDTL